jgi:hypothetical protein
MLMLAIFIAGWGSPAAGGGEVKAKVSQRISQMRLLLLNLILFVGVVSPAAGDGVVKAKLRHISLKLLLMLMLLLMLLLGIPLLQGMAR